MRPPHARRLGELQENWRAEGKQPLDHGIGITTGAVVVGNIGAEGRKMDYTMIGDQANLAARVQSLTRTFRCPIVITESRARSLKALIAADDSSGNRGHVGRVALRRLAAVRGRGRTSRSPSIRSSPSGGRPGREWRRREPPRSWRSRTNKRRR